MPGAVVSAEGFGIRLSYNSRIDHRRSRLVILDGGDREIVVPHDMNGAPNRISAHAPALPPGRYRLRWQVLAIDGHVTRGDIPFRVGP